jgi:hypothetical protein
MKGKKSHFESKTTYKYLHDVLQPISDQRQCLARPRATEAV